MKIRTIWAPLPFRLAVLAVCVLGLSAPARAEAGDSVVAELRAANEGLEESYGELAKLREQAQPSEKDIVKVQAKLQDHVATCKKAAEAYEAWLDVTPPKEVAADGDRLAKWLEGRRKTVSEADLLVSRSVVLCDEMKAQLRKARAGPKLASLGAKDGQHLVDSKTYETLYGEGAKRTLESALEEQTDLQVLDPETRDILLDWVASSIHKELKGSLAGEGDRISDYASAEELGVVLDRRIQGEKDRLVGRVSLRFSDDKVEVYVGGKKVWEAALPEALRKDLRGLGQLAARDKMWQKTIDELLNKRPGSPAGRATPSRAEVKAVADWLRRAQGALAGSKRLAEPRDSAGGAAGMSTALSSRRASLERAVSAVLGAWGRYLKASVHRRQLRADLQTLAGLYDYLDDQPGGGTPGPPPPREREGDVGMDEDDMVGTWRGQVGGQFGGRTLVIRRKNVTHFVGTVDGKEVFTLYAPSGLGFGGDPYASGKVTVTRGGREVEEEWRIDLDSKTQLRLNAGGGGTTTFRKQ